MWFPPRPPLVASRVKLVQFLSRKRKRWQFGLFFLGAGEGGAVAAE